MAIELANHIYRDGEGVPVVLMNAYPVDHRMWDVCAKALADFADLEDVPPFPIWAPDMAGSGESRFPARPIPGRVWPTAHIARLWIDWPMPTLI